MKLYVYGEDGLTLWALKNRLPDILIDTLPFIHTFCFLALSLNYQDH
jgi:hypothetical protein